MGRLDIKSYPYPELETAVAELGLPRFRAGQIFGRQHGKMVCTISGM